MSHFSQKKRFPITFPHLIGKGMGKERLSEVGGANAPHPPLLGIRFPKGQMGKDGERWGNGETYAR